MRLQLSHALVWLNSNKISCIMRGICREFCRCLFYVTGNSEEFPVT